MSHTPAIDLGHDQPPLPNQHFSSWLRGQTTLFISQIVAILGIISFLASMVYYVSHLGEQGKFLRPENLRLVVDYAHIIFMAVFILVLIKVLDDNDRGSYRVRLVYERVFGEPEDELGKLKREEDLKEKLETSKGQLKNFKRRFLWFWIGMLVLYVVFACQHSYELAQFKPGGDAAQHISASFSSEKEGHDGGEENFEFEFELSYRVAGEAHTPVPEASAQGGAGAEPHAPEESAGVAHQASPPPEAERLSWKEAAGRLAFPYLAFLFNNLTLWAVYLCFLIMHLSGDGVEKRYRRSWRASFVALVLLSLPLPGLVYIMDGKLTADDWTAYSSIFDALSGVVNALVLALLIARLDSKLVGLPSWLICILYSYAAVQPLFLVFELKQTAVLKAVAVFVLIFVFISKIYFFLIIIYALQTGKMLNYLVCVTELRKRAGARPKLGGRLFAFGKALAVVAAAYFILYLLAPLAFPNGGDPGSSIGYVWMYLRPENWHVDVVQLAVVLGMIVSLRLWLWRNDYDEGLVAMATAHLFSEVPPHAHSTKDGQEQLKKFKLYFLSFLGVTFLLYVVLLLDDLQVRFCVDAAGHLSLQRAVSGVVYNCGTNYLPDSLVRMVGILPYPFLEFSLATFNLMFVFWCFVVLHTPGFGERAQVRQRLIFNYSRFVILLLIAIFPLLLFLIGGPKLTPVELRGYATVFNGVTGMLSAVALALLIARMDSTLFGLPRWSLWAMFIYAAIQPLFIAFPLNLNIPVLNTVRMATLIAAFLLKIFFFLIVAHSLWSGRVINYLVCFPLLRDRVDSIFENQFEITLARADHGLYTFSILKKNKPYYSTALKFESRQACDAFVRYLRELMGWADAYQLPPQVSGTYWVEVRSLRGDLICESIPLRSDKEAAAMVGESREKIPYCKYNRE